MLYPRMHTRKCCISFSSLCDYKENAISLHASSVTSVTRRQTKLVTIYLNWIAWLPDFVDQWSRLAASFTGLTMNHTKIGTSPYKWEPRPSQLGISCSRKCGHTTLPCPLACRAL